MLGFCAPEMLTKFWGFAAGMDFDTQYFLNLMSQMHDFCLSNSIPSIFYGIISFIPILQISKYT